MLLLFVWFSITIAWKGGDIPSGWWDLLIAFFEVNFHRGVMALEAKTGEGSAGVIVVMALRTTGEGSAGASRERSKASAVKVAWNIINANQMACDLHS